MGDVNLGTLSAQLGLDTRAFDAATISAQRTVRNFGRNLSQAGRTLTTRLTLPLVAAGGAAVKMGADFEASLQKIVGLVGVSQKQVNAWRADILKLGPATAKGPKELANAMFFVTSAGLRGQRALNTLALSAKAASAGLGDTVTVADGLTSALNAYSKSGLTAAKATGILVATVREGKLEAGSLAPVLGNVLPIASKLGVSFDQVGAALASMTRLGADAAKSATALRGILNKILNPSKEGEKVLKQFGLSTKALRQELQENGLLSALNLLQDRFRGNEEAMSAVFPDIRGLTGVLNLLGDNAEEAERIFASLAEETGESLNNAFEVASKTAKFKFNQSLAQLQKTLITLSNSLLPIFVGLLNALNRALVGVTNALNRMTPAQRALMIATAAVAAALGPLMLILGPMVRGVDLLARGFIFLGGALSGLIKIEFVNRIMLTLNKNVSLLGPAVGGLALKIAFVASVVALWAGILRQLGGSLKGIFNVVKSLITKFTTMISKVQFLAVAFSFWKEKIQEITPVIVNAAKQAGQNIATTFKAGIDEINDATGGLDNVQANILAAFNFEGMMGALGGQFTVLGEFLNRQFAALSAGFGGGGEGDFGGGMDSGGGGGMAGGGGEEATGSGFLSQFFNMQFSEIQAGGATLFTSLTEGFGQSISTMVTQGATLKSSMMSLFTSIAGSIIGSMGRIGASFALTGAKALLFSKTTAAATQAATLPSIYLQAFNAIVGIPVIGPGLAPAAAGAALAQAKAGASAAGALGSIPALAKGGLVNQPTLALIGEAGPEVVTPLDRLGDFGGSKSQTINIMLDSELITQTVIRGMPDQLSLETGARF